MSSIDDFSGKTVLVTGATSGVGKACCKHLDRAGARLVLVARSEEGLGSIMGMLDGSDHVALPCDLSVKSQVDGLFSMLRAQGLVLDGLVHSAGQTYNSGVSIFDYETALNLFNLNFFSFCTMVKHCSKRRYMHDGSSIVAISSLAALRGSKGQSDYAASKAALDAYVRIAAKELIKRKVRLNAVLPSQIDTEMTQRFFSEIDGGREIALQSQALGLIDPDVLARFVAFLLSDDGKYLTGQEFPYDAGSMSRDRTDLNEGR